MVSADTAPVLPWGASKERQNVQEVDARHAGLSLSLTTSESEPDHTGTPQVEEAWPSTGSTIEVYISFYVICGVCNSDSLVSCSSVKVESLTICAFRAQVRWQLEDDTKTETIVSICLCSANSADQ